MIFKYVLKCSILIIAINFQNVKSDFNDSIISKVNGDNSTKDSFLIISDRNYENYKTKQLSNVTNAVSGGVSNVISRIPCSCIKGQCGCCSGPLLASFNQKACLNITYEPEEFAFNAALSLNDRVFYKNRISGKNPPPICVRVPRIRIVQVCVKLSNVYFTGANMHTCVNMEANWEDFTIFDTSFDCFRIGAAGVAVVPPEDGGGISSNVDEDDDDDSDDDEDYDDSA